MLAPAGPSGCAAASIPMCIACACVGHRLGRHHSRLAARQDSQAAGRGSRQGVGGDGGGVHSAQNSPGAIEGRSETLNERLRPRPAPAVAHVVPAGLQSRPQLRGARSTRER